MSCYVGGSSCSFFSLFQACLSCKISPDRSKQFKEIQLFVTFAGLSIQCPERYGKGIILTKAHRAAVSMMAKGCIEASSTSPEVCFSFTTQLYSHLCNYNVIVLIS